MLLKAFEGFYLKVSLPFLTKIKWLSQVWWYILQSHLQGRWRWVACGLRPSWEKSISPYLKNKLRQKGLEVWLSGRVLGQQHKATPNTTKKFKK
jgi:hypothetical protein